MRKKAEAEQEQEQEEQQQQEQQQQCGNEYVAFVRETVRLLEGYDRSAARGLEYYIRARARMGGGGSGVG